MTAKLSPAQIRVLRNERDGLAVHTGCKTRSHWGGLGQVIDALTRKRLIDKDGITEAGRAALAKAEETL